MTFFLTTVKPENRCQGVSREGKQKSLSKILSDGAQRRRTSLATQEEQRNVQGNEVSGG